MSLQLKTLNIVCSLSELDRVPSGKMLINTINAHSYNTAQEDEAFAEALSRGDYLIPDGASIVKACSHDRLKEHLADKHFYIFPTSEPREGHSNALTEGMAWGLIPVATDIGFNRAIVGDDMLIVKQLSAKAFDDILANVVDSGKIQEQSERAYHRIQSNYTEDIVYNRLKEEYNTLFSLCHTTRES